MVDRIMVIRVAGTLGKNFWINIAFVIVFCVAAFVVIVSAMFHWNLLGNQFG